MKEIVIIIENGCLRTVFAPKEFNVTLIDFDAREEAGETSSDLEKEAIDLKKRYQLEEIY